MKVQRKGTTRIGIERVSVPIPWVQLGNDRASVTLSATSLELGLKRLPGHHWIRTGVTLSDSFSPRWGWCSHWQYRNIVHRSALAFGCGGFYLMRMPRNTLIPEDD